MTAFLMLLLGDPIVTEARQLLTTPPLSVVLTIDAPQDYTPRPTRNAVAFHDTRTGAIVVLRSGEPYRKRDLARLAAALVHEQAHLDGHGETEAYRCEAAELRRLGARRGYVTRLESLVKARAALGVR